MELETEIRQLSSLLEKAALAKKVRELMPAQNHRDPEFNGYYSINRFEKDLTRSYRIELDYRSFAFQDLHQFEPFAEAFVGFYNALAAQPVSFRQESYQYFDDYLVGGHTVAGLDTNKHYIYLECRKNDVEARQIIDEFASILAHS
ncbi:MAG: hypothetical protein EPN86_06040 [Nanoarchaeota archaeon]|nr:MAG: hypothetical protein EPN86_06040 [Nanoarchaeota archaeon]